MHKCVHTEKYGNMQCTKSIWVVYSKQCCTLLSLNGGRLECRKEDAGPPTYFQIVRGGHVVGADDILNVFYGTFTNPCAFERASLIFSHIQLQIICKNRMGCMIQLKTNRSNRSLCFIPFWPFCILRLTKRRLSSSVLSNL